MVGCTTPPAPVADALTVGDHGGVQRHELEQPPRLTIHRGSTQTPMNWPALVNEALQADVVILGEQHNDAIGHAVQLALVKAIVQQAPRAAVALEMLERDEQPLLDDYRDGIIDANTFAKLTQSEQWAGKGSWGAWYQPIIDVGIDNGALVIAANAPRRYVRRARTNGFDSLDNIDRTRKGFFTTPRKPLMGPYRDRFMDLMAGHGDEVDLEVQESFFRAQQMWDATMADSVVDTVRAGHRPVILLVGRFHSDRGGGTVQFIEQAWPWVKILVISLEPSLHPGDTPSGGVVEHDDIVVFTNP